MFDNIRGVITFSVFTADTDRFVNILRESAISARNVTVSKNEVKGRVYRRDFAELKELARKSGSEAVALEKNGLIFTVKKYDRRYGIAVGALLAAALIRFLSNIVLTIEIYGNEKLSEESITALLSEQGIHIGAYIPNIDLRKAESLLLTASDDLTWLGLRSSGCRILVEVSERGDEPEMERTFSPRNIVAARDAQIVGIKNLHSGLLVPMLGDGVKKGDILISGTIQTDYGGTYLVHASGDIIGRYSQKEVFTQSLTDAYTEPRGKSLKKSLYFFGARIPLYLKSGAEGEFEYDEEIKLCGVFSLKLPVGFVYSEYRMFETVEKEYAPPEAKALLEEKIRLYETNFLQGEAIRVVDKEIQFTETKTEVSAVLKLTIEGNIGEPRDIFAKRQP